MEDIEKLLIEEFKKNNVNFDNNFRYDYVDDSFTEVLKSVFNVFSKIEQKKALINMMDEDSKSGIYD